MDDATQIVSVNLKKSLVADPRSRPQPLNYHERTEMVLAEEENILQSELEQICFFYRDKQISDQQGQMLRNDVFTFKKV